MWVWFGLFGARECQSALGVCSFVRSFGDHAIIASVATGFFLNYINIAWCSDDAHAPLYTYSRRETRTNAFGKIRGTTQRRRGEGRIRMERFRRRTTRRRTRSITRSRGTSRRTNSRRRNTRINSRRRNRGTSIPRSSSGRRNGEGRVFFVSVARRAFRGVHGGVRRGDTVEVHVHL